MYWIHTMYDHLQKSGKNHDTIFFRNQKKNGIDSIAYKCIIFTLNVELKYVSLYIVFVHS